MTAKRLPWYELDCKSARDNLYNIAVRQGKVEWFREIEMDEERFASLIQVYKDRCPCDPETGKRKGGRGANKFCLMQYSKEFETSTEIAKADDLSMICYTEFLEFSRTVRGGRLSSTDAEAKWNYMKSHKDEYVWDEDGPVGEELQFGVKLGPTVLSFINRQKVSAKVQLLKKAVKDPTADAITEATESLKTGHDKLGNVCMYILCNTQRIYIYIYMYVYV